MKRILSIALVLVVLAFLVYPKVREYVDLKDNKALAGSKVSVPLAVEVYITSPQSIDENIFITGTLTANEEVDLVCESSGIIEEIYLEEGKGVNKGDLLIKLNDSELQAQLKRSEFRLNLAEDIEKRQKQLLEKGGISQEEYDATLNEVNVLKAEVAVINAQIAQKEVRAPFAGTLGLKYVSDGSYISPSTRIATLQDIDPIKIDFAVPERYAALVNVGDKISFSVQGVENKLEALVYAKEPRIDTDTRTLQVRAKSANKDNKLLPGSFADIELTLDTIHDALMIPTIALVPELQGQKVYLYKNGVVKEQSVKIGIRDEYNIQIIEGLSAGDTVLTTGLLQVLPEMEVTISNLSGE